MTTNLKRIAVIDDKTCDKCQEADGKIYQSHNIPELVDGCDHIENGGICRCAYLVINKTGSELKDEMEEK